MGGSRIGIWTDNPEGLDTDLRLINKPNIGSEANPAGLVAAQKVTVVTSVLPDTIPADGTLEFDGSDLTVVIAGVRSVITVS